MKASNSVATQIEISSEVSSSGEGEIQRGLDIAKLLKEGHLLGVSFNMVFPPLVNDILEGQDLQEWRNNQVYMILDDGAIKTSNMEEWEISYSHMVEGLCHLTSPCCHISIYASDNGVVVSGLVYATEQLFDLNDFITNLTCEFSEPRMTVEVTPLSRP